MRKQAANNGQDLAWLRKCAIRCAGYEQRESDKLMPPKISDVARLANVHPSTVSRALDPTKRSRISDEIVARVTKIANDIGYRPNAVAASMRTGSTRTIGVVVHDVNDPIYPPLIKGLEDAVLDTGLMVMLGNGGFSADRASGLVDRMIARAVDGIVLATTVLDDPLVEKCLAAKIPTVSMVRYPRDGSVTSVVNDCVSGMEQMTQHVIECGHQRVACIAGPQTSSAGHNRLIGVRSSLHRSGIDLPPEFLKITDQPRMEAGYAATMELLSLATPPTAIICVNDVVAMGAMRACRELGVSCPEDVSITGFNNVAFTEFVAPGLTTVAVDFQRIGDLAGRALLSEIEGKCPQKNIQTVPCHVVSRDSLRVI
ncbi:LacI family transcriptional regulator [Roseobacter sp. YSTF-M11]|uniref:LacI family transcriptional regulator n=1 Tax=Roseobacter insulae TaxID=2859783 RepID=A0A9X1JYM5_9RHOB|nr:LacI family DNA-binding transcriptional regulator [Roseobacter insulae]MBW4706364.1 LacI family transcriptional regulator [Roseobacter insulae]